MKRLTILTALLAFTLAFTTTESKAQFSNFLLNKTATSAGVDTITGNIQYPGSIAMTSVVTMTQISGTQGKIVLFGSNLGNTYTRLDSTTVNYVGSTATIDYTYNHFTNTKFDKPDFLLYRFVWYQTAGSVSAAKGRALVRTGGN